MTTRTLPEDALTEMQACDLSPEQMEFMKKLWTFAFNRGFAAGRKGVTRKAFELGVLDAENRGPREPMDERMREYAG